MRRLLAAETAESPTDKELYSKEKSAESKEVKGNPYPIFFSAIKDLNKEVEELVKEGESLCSDEKKNIQDPNKEEILTDFTDFLRSTRQYWKLAVLTVSRLPARTPGWLTLIADPKEYFKKEEEDDINFPPRLNESKSKRAKAVKDLAEAFKKETSKSGKSIPKGMDIGDMQDYIRSLFNYIVKHDISLLSSKDDLDAMADLIEEVSVSILGEERAENLSPMIKEVIRKSKQEKKQQAKAFRSLCRFARQENWTSWKQKIEKISEKIEALTPLYRNLSEAWMPEKYSKNRKMLRNFFIGKTDNSGLRFYGRNVLVPSVEIYLDRIYGKEAPEQQHQNDITLQIGIVENQRALLENEVSQLKEDQLAATEEVIGRLREKSKSSPNSKKDLDIVEKKIENITKDMHQKLDEVMRDKRSGAEDRQRQDIEDASKSLLSQLQTISEELEEVQKKESVAQQDKENQGNRAVASNFRVLSIYAEEESSSLLKPFVFVLNKFKELKNKVNQWIGGKSENKNTKEEVDIKEEEEVKKKLTETYREYKQKIVEGVNQQVKKMKEAGSSNPELTAKINPLFDKFLEALPKALDEQLSKYQKTLNLLMGGNKTIQETFKADAEKIIQELFETHVTANLKTATSRMFNLRLGADALLAPNDKVLSQNIQKDVANSKKEEIKDITVKNPMQKEEDKEGGIPKLDKKILDNILVDSFKATIDNNKDEVEALLSKSEK